MIYRRFSLGMRTFSRRQSMTELTRLRSFSSSRTRHLYDWLQWHSSSRWRFSHSFAFVNWQTWHLIESRHRHIDCSAYKNKRHLNHLIFNFSPLHFATAFTDYVYTAFVAAYDCRNFSFTLIIAARSAKSLTITRTWTKISLLLQYDTVYWGMTARGCMD